VADGIRLPPSVPFSTRSPLIFHFTQPHSAIYPTTHFLPTSQQNRNSRIYLYRNTTRNNYSRTTHVPLTRHLFHDNNHTYVDPMMTDFIPADEMKPEFLEFEKANRVVIEDPDDFEAWEKLVRIAETLEGGLNRNSSPQAIALTRGVFDRFLAKFPLLFGYWKKYADMEFSIAGTEAAEMVSAGVNMRLGI